MPNRILKESICTSESIDSLTEFQEVFFYRLIVNCDDFGRFDARPKILSSRLFPLRPIALELIENALDALVREQMIELYNVNGKPYLQVNSWGSHQNPRANKSKYPAPESSDPQADDIGCKQMISDDIKCEQTKSDATYIRYSILDNRNTRIDIRESDSYSVSESDSKQLMSDDAAHEIQHEQDQVLDAAADAGFPSTNAVRAQLLALFAEHGMDKMIHAINECAVHSAASIAYLKAVLAGSGRRRSKPKVAAQDFEQRDYSDVPDEMAKSLDNEVAEFLKAQEG